MSEENRERWAHLYQWVCLDTNPSVRDDALYFEFEKQCRRYHIRTRVLATEDGKGTRLMVPRKDAEVAEALFSGAVKSVMTAPPETYYVFDESLNYLNEALYDHGGDARIKRIRRRNWILLILTLVIVGVTLALIRATQ